MAFFNITCIAQFFCQNKKTKKNKKNEGKNK